jgi:hypothetical protein
LNNPNGNNSNGWAQTPDFFIAKFNPKGDTLLFGTYLGGSGQDIPQTIAVDSDGAVYVWGSTSSTDFPTKNAYLSTAPTGLAYRHYAGALVKLSADGSQLLYSTYIGAGAGGSANAEAAYLTPDQLALAPDGIAYVAGYTGDPAGQTFSSAVNAQFTGGADFVAKFDTTKSGASSLLYATPIGPPAAQNNLNNSVTVSGIAVDSKGNLWISGDTLNNGFPSPTARAVQSGCGYPSQCNSPYLMELDPTGQSTLYATFFGGTTNVGGGPGIDYATGLSLDSQDNIYWGGRTEDADFPTKNPAHTVSDVGAAGWVAEFAAGGYPVLYSSYVPCWPFSVGGYKSATDTMVSFTCSQGGNNLPLKNQISSGRAFGYNYDAYFGVYDTAGSGPSSILVESYLGSGNGVTSPYKTTFDPQGSLWLAGSTSATDLPVVDPFQAACDTCQPSSGPTPDGFVTRIALVQIAPVSISFPSTNAGSTSTALTATISSLYGTAVTLGPGTLTDDTDFTQSDNCGGTVAPFGSCEVTFTFTPASSGALNSTYSIAASAPNGSLLADLSVSLSGIGLGSFTISPTTQSFSATAVGSTSSAAISTISNTTSSAVYLSAGSLTDSADFTQSDNCNGIVASAGTCIVTFAFRPQSTGALTSTYSIHDVNNPNSPLTVLLSGTGTPAPSPQAVLSPTSLVFTAAANEAAGNQSVTLSNPGNAPLSISSVAVSGVNAASFTIASNTCGSSLVAGGKCTIAIGFPAAAAGTYNATLTVTDNASPATQTATLTCTVTGVGQAKLTPPSVDFGNVSTGSTAASQTFTLANIGFAPFSITFIGLTGANSSSFSVTSNTCGTSLAAGASCSIAVNFTPSDPVQQSASLTVVDSVGTQTSSLGGVGVAPPPPPDFALTATPAAQTSYLGASVTYQLAVAPLVTTNPFNSAVTLSVSGLPSGATASFAPGSVTPGAASAGSVMTVTIPALRGQNRGVPADGRPAAPPIVFATLLLAFGLARNKRVRKQFSSAQMLFLLALIGGLCATIAGCGGTGFAVPQSTSTITVTGTSGTLTHSATVTLTLK